MKKTTIQKVFGYWFYHNIISHKAYQMYVLIDVLQNNQIEISQADLAKRMRVSKNTLREALAELEQAKLLKITRVINNKGWHNSYELIEPRQH